MAVPSSGELRLYADIGVELGVSQSNVSLGSMSDSAGFSEPDAMSDFYGYVDAVVPSATTNSMTSIGETSMTLNGNITSDGGATIIERGFYFGTNSASPLNNTKYTVSGTTGAFSLGRSGLSSGTGYYCWAFATNSVGTTYGSSVYAATIAAFAPVYGTVTDYRNRTLLNVGIVGGNYNWRQRGYFQYLNPNTGSYITRGSYITTETTPSRTITITNNPLMGQWATNTKNRWLQYYDQFPNDHSVDGEISCYADSGKYFYNQVYTSGDNGNGYLYSGYNSGTGNLQQVYIAPTTFGNYFSWTEGYVQMDFNYTG